MTILVGVKCSDGVVIGADSTATSSAGASPLIQIQSVNKIDIFDNSIIVAATGAVGYAQRLNHHVQQAISGGVFKNLVVNECITNIPHRFLRDLTNSNAPHHPNGGIRFGALLAAYIKGTPCLVEYQTTDFQPGIKQGQMFFVSLGSGQILADPFIAFVSRVLWKGNAPSVEDAKLGVYWTLAHTIKLAPGGVGEPIKIATLRERNGRWVAEELQNTQEASAAHRRTRSPYRPVCPTDRRGRASFANSNANPTFATGPRFREFRGRWVAITA
jgi:Proteasome subunit